jgi:hypothetical protein
MAILMGESTNKHHEFQIYIILNLDFIYEKYYLKSLNNLFEVMTN